jgi:hypothetical protein
MIEFRAIEYDFKEPDPPLKLPGPELRPFFPIDSALLLLVYCFVGEIFDPNILAL